MVAVMAIGLVTSDPSAGEGAVIEGGGGAFGWALGPNTWSVIGRLATGLPAPSIAETVSAWFWPSSAPGTLKGEMSRLAAGGKGTLMVFASPAIRCHGVDSLPWQARSKPRVFRTWCVSVNVVVTPPRMT